MTCIVGCVHKGIVYMGGDSACSNQQELSIQADRKVAMNRGILIGCAGDVLIGDLIQHAFVPPSYRPNEDVFMYLLKKFTSTMKRTLKYEGLLGRFEKECSLLIGLQGRLFQIDAEFQILEAACTYDATGSGAFFALGSMHSTADLLPPSDRIYQALRAAEAHCPTVRGPFSLEILEPYKEDEQKRFSLFSRRKY